jgi:hypothetical protein
MTNLLNLTHTTDHSSGVPALRRPAREVVSNRACIGGGTTGPATPRNREVERWPVCRADDHRHAKPARRQHHVLDIVLCHCTGLDETSAPSGPGPPSHDPESAQIRSGAQSSSIRKLAVLTGANPRCPLGNRMRSEDPDNGTCRNP